MMVELNTSIQQVAVKVTNNETGAINYLIINEDNKWEKITQNQYNKIRGNKNE